MHTPTHTACDLWYAVVLNLKRMNENKRTKSSRCVCTERRKRARRREICRAFEMLGEYNCIEYRNCVRGDTQWTYSVSDLCALKEEEEEIEK